MTPQVWQLIVLQGVICGTAGAILYAPVLVWMTQWFHERRGLAGGIIWSGTGIGGFLCGLDIILSGSPSR